MKNMLQLKAEALRSQVFRKLGVDKIPECMDSGWEDNVRAVEKHGVGVVDSIVLVIKGAMEDGLEDGTKGHWVQAE